MRFFYVLSLTLTLSLGLSFSNNYDELRKAVNNKFKSFTKEDFIKMQSPKRPTQAENELLQKFKSSDLNVKSNEHLQDAGPLPASFRVPGEFEEVQAVLVSWPSYAFDKDTNWVDAFTPGVGILWNPTTQTEELVPIAFWMLDLFEDSPYPPVWAALIDAIQPEAQAWIRVAAPQDTTYLKMYLQSIGVNLYNYKFITDPDGENAFWMRDFGPYGMYYGEGDTLGFVNAQYYPGRPIDNMFPQFLANKMNAKLWNTAVETEGGNFITDGHDNIFYSSVIYGNNADQYGPGYEYKAPMSSQTVDADMTKYFAAKRSTVLNHLYCDGGTGHIDLYLKMIDDETFMIAKFPTQFNVDSFPDYTIINNNRAVLSNLKAFTNESYHFVNVPIPTKDDGTYTPIGCYNFNSDARNYINGLTVNKTFIMPIYSDNTSGNKEADAKAVEYMKKELNGYKIYPIDVRSLSPLGGAIHCVTMQIPAENPVFWAHKKYKGRIKPVPNTLEFVAEIKNHSGIKKATLYWKKNNLENLNSIEMIEKDGKFYAEISATEFPNQNDTIHYHIKAETNNGKTAYHPISAPEGNFTAFVDYFMSVEELSDNANSFDIIGIYPNPVSSNAEIRFEVINAGNVELNIINSIGDNVANISNEYLNQGTYSSSIDVSELPSGIYVIVLKSNNQIKHKKLVINR